MTTYKLNDTTKDILKQLELKDAAPVYVPIGEMKHSFKIQNDSKPNSIPNKVLDSIRIITENKDFTEFVKTKECNKTITTGKDIFNKDLFDYDVEVHQQNIEQQRQYLLENQPNPLNLQAVSLWKQKFDKLREQIKQIPNEKDSKYHTPEKVLVKFNGNEIVNSLLELNDKFNELDNEFVKWAHDKNYEYGHIEGWTEKDFKFLKTLHKFNQLNGDNLTLPAYCHSRQTVLNVIECFETLKDYHESLKTCNVIGIFPLASYGEFYRLEQENKQNEILNRKLEFVNEDILGMCDSVLAYRKEFNTTKEIEESKRQLETLHELVS